MQILAVGINHKTASIDLREKFCLSTVERELLIAELKSDPRVMSAVVLSTCNRCEVYAAVVDGYDAQNMVVRLFAVKHLAVTPQMQGMFYAHQGAAAVKHFMQVACGLDSLILGEKQILGQIKEAVQLSRTLGLMDKTLNVLTNYVLETGKKARQDTQIDFGGVSVSAAAVTMAQKVLGTLEDKKVLVLGSGKMGQLALNYLHQKKAKEILLMNRTEEKAALMAREYHAKSVPFWNMKEVLTEVDVCICSSGAPHYLISKDLVEAVAAGRTSSLLLIDISMPRNIDPNAGSVAGAQLVGLDELDRVIEDNLLKRQASVVQVDLLICRKVEEFYNAIGKIALLESGDGLVVHKGTS